MVQRPQNVHAHYHAHVYFDKSSLSEARELCERAASRFGVGMGRVHERLVGPHLRWSCQLTFDSEQFDALIPWLEAHRSGLSILVHADTGENLKDHTDYAAWLGDPVPLDLSHFRH